MKLTSIRGLRWLLLIVAVAVGVHVEGANEAEADADRRLNSAYRALRATLGESAKQNLKDEQLDWLKRRDAIASPSAKLSFIEQRVADLARRAETEVAKTARGSSDSVGAAETASSPRETPTKSNTETISGIYHHVSTVQVGNFWNNKEPINRGPDDKYWIAISGSPERLKANHYNAYTEDLLRIRAGNVYVTPTRKSNVIQTDHIYTFDEGGVLRIETTTRVPDQTLKVYDVYRKPPR